MPQVINYRIKSDSYKPRTERLNTLVLHYTAGNLQGSLDVLVNRDVSAHYVVAENGDIYKILEDNEVAFHAGLSTWRGKRGVNARSIGIEIVNLDGNTHSYPSIQTQAVIWLCQEILKRNPAIEARNVVGHSDIAPKRKPDPGVRFPWKTLASAGVGLWPDPATSQLHGATEAQVLRALQRFGYIGPHCYGKKGETRVYVDCANPGTGPVTTVSYKNLLTAFQMHFCPQAVTGKADLQTIRTLDALLKLVGDKP